MPFVLTLMPIQCYNIYMNNNLYNLHKNCDIVINWARVNAYGCPALCCADHFDKKKRLQWLDWLNTKQLAYCINELKITEIHCEPDPHYRENSVKGNFSAYT